MQNPRPHRAGWLFARHPLAERGALIILDIACVLYFVLGVVVWVWQREVVTFTFPLLWRGEADIYGVWILSVLMLIIGAPATAVSLVLAYWAKGLPRIVRIISIVPPLACVVMALAILVLGILLAS